MSTSAKVMDQNQGKKSRVHLNYKLSSLSANHHEYSFKHVEYNKKKENASTIDCKIKETSNNTESKPTTNTRSKQSTRIQKMRTSKENTSTKPSSRVGRNIPTKEKYSRYASRVDIGDKKDEKTNKNTALSRQLINKNTNDGKKVNVKNISRTEVKRAKMKLHKHQNQSTKNESVTTLKIDIQFGKENENEIANVKVEQRHSKPHVGDSKPNPDALVVMILGQDETDKTENLIISHGEFIDSSQSKPNKFFMKENENSGNIPERDRDVMDQNDKFSLEGGDGIHISLPSMSTAENDYIISKSNANNENKDIFDLPRKDDVKLLENDQRSKGYSMLEHSTIINCMEMKNEIEKLPYPEINETEIKDDLVTEHEHVNKNKDISDSSIQTSLKEENDKEEKEILNIIRLMSLIINDVESEQHHVKEENVNVSKIIDDVVEENEVNKIETEIRKIIEVHLPSLIKDVNKIEDDLMENDNIINEINNTAGTVSEKKEYITREPEKPKNIEMKCLQITNDTKCKHDFAIKDGNDTKIKDIDNPTSNELVQEEEIVGTNNQTENIAELIFSEKLIGTEMKCDFTEETENIVSKDIDYTNPNVVIEALESIMAGNENKMNVEIINHGEIEYDVTIRNKQTYENDESRNKKQDKDTVKKENIRIDHATKDVEFNSSEETEYVAITEKTHEDEFLEHPIRYDEIGETEYTMEEKEIKKSDRENRFREDDFLESETSNTEDEDSNISPTENHADKELTENADDNVMVENDAAENNLKAADNEHATDNNLEAPASVIYADDNNLEAADNEIHAGDDELHATDNNLEAADNDLHAPDNLKVTDNELHPASDNLKAPDNNLEVANIKKHTPDNELHAADHNLKTAYNEVETDYIEINSSEYNLKLADDELHTDVIKLELHDHEIYVTDTEVDENPDDSEQIEDVSDLRERPLENDLNASDKELAEDQDIKRADINEAEYLEGSNKIEQNAFSNELLEYASNNVQKEEEDFFAENKLTENAEEKVLTKNPEENLPTQNVEERELVEKAGEKALPNNDSTNGDPEENAPKSPMFYVGLSFVMGLMSSVFMRDRGMAVVSRGMAVINQGMAVRLYYWLAPLAKRD
ncbi:hypothetical protein WDU94_003043 [Cyamophila willieti]